METERLLLQLEAQVFQELLSSAKNNNNNNNNSNSKRIVQSKKQDFMPPVNAGIDQTVTEIKRALKEVEGLIPTERDPLKREVHRKKLESNTTRLVGLERMGAAQQKASKIKMERGQLFDPESPMVGLGGYAAEAQSLQNSRKTVSQIIEMGVSVLGSLGSQTESIKRATGKVESVSTSLGLSNSVMRAVKRRQFGDAAIVYGAFLPSPLLCTKRGHAD